MNVSNHQGTGRRLAGAPADHSPHGGTSGHTATVRGKNRERLPLQRPSDRSLPIEEDADRPTSNHTEDGQLTEGATPSAESITSERLRAQAAARREWQRLFGADAERTSRGGTTWVR